MVPFRGVPLTLSVFSIPTLLGLGFSPFLVWFFSNPWCRMQILFVFVSLSKRNQSQAFCHPNTTCAPPSWRPFVDIRSFTSLLFPLFFPFPPAAIFKRGVFFVESCFSRLLPRLWWEPAPLTSVAVHSVDELENVSCTHCLFCVLELLTQRCVPSFFLPNNQPPLGPSLLVPPWMVSKVTVKILRAESKTNSFIHSLCFEFSRGTHTCETFIDFYSPLCFRSIKAPPLYAGTQTTPTPLRL